MTARDSQYRQVKSADTDVCDMDKNAVTQHMYLDKVFIRNDRPALLPAPKCFMGCRLICILQPSEVSVF